MEGDDGDEVEGEGEDSGGSMCESCTHAESKGESE